MARSLVLLALAALLLSGCSDDPAPASNAGDDVSPAPTDGSGPGLDAAADGEDGGPVAAREEPLQVSGRSATGVCGGVGGVAGNCFNDLGDGNLQPLDRSALAVRGTLAWTASSPATQVMGVIVLVPCGDGCWTNNGEAPSAYGESPLAIDFDLTGLDERAALWFSAYQGAYQAGAWGGVALPQDFTFDGTVSLAE